MRDESFLIDIDKSACDITCNVCCTKCPKTVFKKRVSKATGQTELIVDDFKCDLCNGLTQCQFFCPNFAISIC